MCGQHTGDKVGNDNKLPRFLHLTQEKGDLIYLQNADAACEKIGGPDSNLASITVSLTRDQRVERFTAQFAVDVSCSLREEQRKSVVKGSLPEQGYFRAPRIHWFETELAPLHGGCDRGFNGVVVLDPASPG